MIILSDMAEYAGKPSVLALGMFDGVHIGHQALIREAVRIGKEENLTSVVCTFDVHPLSVLCPERAPKPLLSMEENLLRMERLHVDAALLHRFTREFADMLPEDYLKMMLGKMNAKVLVMGENHTFGRKGAGNADLVRRLAKEYGYRAVVVPDVRDREGLVSSTRIRKLYAEGQKVRAAALMGVL